MAELIIALDLPQQEKALTLAEELQGVVPWCKVGMELFTLAGPALLARLKGMGFKVFLDLKFYDIPHTVGQAVRAAAAVGVDLLTL
ncbi:MAG: orotidine 5'-phosphate decarboxylase / HUMPS family protein, partial [Desulfovibrionaceae bacterium]|nr:orotidine 5'-phosphate decarboxylase / HUMPS family protein [Desulfovibrionaceae bacterium]